MNTELAKILNQVLGPGKKTAKNNMAFQCPFCNTTKKKLEVQLITNEKGENDWHCWVCNISGKKIRTLFKPLNVPRHILTDLYKIIKSNNKYTDFNIDSIRRTMAEVKLPIEYIPLYKKSNSIEYKNALHYLYHKRKLTLSEIVKYGIGYCESGEYAYKIIIPSYDGDGKLNYFVGRSYYDESTHKHKNPDASKNIIPMELFINWQLPIVLCEGAFDAIAIRRNAIPLFGKVIPEKLKLKIVRENVKTIYIALDRDAQKQAMQHAEYFINNGCNVYFVDLNEKDPAEIGFEGMCKLIKESTQLTEYDLLKMKVLL
jgi:transcription elongation factor Elf1